MEGNISSVENTGTAPGQHLAQNGPVAIGGRNKSLTRSEARPQRTSGQKRRLLPARLRWAGIWGDTRIAVKSGRFFRACLPGVNNCPIRPFSARDTAGDPRVVWNRPKLFRTLPRGFKRDAGRTDRMRLLRRCGALLCVRRVRGVPRVRRFRSVRALPPCRELYGVREYRRLRRVRG